MFVMVNVNNSCLNTETTVRFLSSRGCGLAYGSAPRVFFANGSVDSSTLTRVVRLYRNGSISMGVVSGSNAAARPTVTFHIFHRVLRGGCNGRNTERHVCYAASGTGNALGTLTSRRNCRAFIIPSSMNNHFSILATMNLLPVTISNTSVSTLVRNTTATRGRFSGSSLGAGSYCGCTTVEGVLCHGNGAVRIVISCRPTCAVVSR